LGAWGVRRSSFVVAYDDASGAIAARLWWLLRWLGHEHVAVLDGGLDAWLTAGHALETAPPDWQATHYAPNTIHDDWVVQTDAIERCLDSGALLLDARSEARFRGVEEPIDPVAGHVPGARNLPFTALLAADGTLLEAEALNNALTPTIGKREGEDVIAMCGSGVTACHLLLALDAAGRRGGKLYAGSWSEWIRDGDREIATGEEA
jgi:thiosulfate/3-mercaptopyruvate sulfurtransferase